MCMTAIEHDNDKCNSQSSQQILLSVKDQQALILSCTLGAKSAIYDCLIVVKKFEIWHFRECCLPPLRCPLAPRSSPNFQD